VYAVIETGGRQVRVEPGQTVRLARLGAEPGTEVTLDRVLLVSDDGEVRVGTPVVEGARVVARVLHQGRARKIRVFKFKAKAHSRRRQGHRQPFTEVRIERIETP
jgi:large subunit ribosomal protein L21